MRLLHSPGGRSVPRISSALAKPMHVVLSAPSRTTSTCPMASHEGGWCWVERRAGIETSK